MRIIGFLLLGSGFKNSSKIYELVFTFLSLDQAGEKVKGVDSVMNHLNDDDMIQGINYLSLIVIVP